MDGFLMEVEWIQQRGDLKEEGAVGVKASFQRVRSPGWGLLGAGARGRKT